MTLRSINIHTPKMKRSPKRKGDKKKDVVNLRFSEEDQGKQI